MLKKIFTIQQCSVLLIALTALLVFSHHAAVAQEPCALPQNITYPLLGSLGGTFTQGDGWRNVSCMGAGRVILVTIIKGMSYVATGGSGPMRALCAN